MQMMSTVVLKELLTPISSTKIVVSCETSASTIVTPGGSYGLPFSAKKNKRKNEFDKGLGLWGKSKLITCANF